MALSYRPSEAKELGGGGRCLCINVSPTCYLARCTPMMCESIMVRHITAKDSAWHLLVAGCGVWAPKAKLGLAATRCRSCGGSFDDLLSALVAHCSSAPAIMHFQLVSLLACTLAAAAQPSTSSAPPPGPTVVAPTLISIDTPSSAIAGTAGLYYGYTEGPISSGSYRAIAYDLTYPNGTTTERVSGLNTQETTR